MSGKSEWNVRIFHFYPFHGPLFIAHICGRELRRWLFRLEGAIFCKADNFMTLKMIVLTNEKFVDIIEFCRIVEGKGGKDFALFEKESFFALGS